MHPRRVNICRKYTCSLPKDTVPAAGTISQIYIPLVHLFSPPRQHSQGRYHIINCRSRGSLVWNIISLYGGPKNLGLGSDFINRSCIYVLIHYPGLIIIIRLVFQVRKEMKCSFYQCNVDNYETAAIPGRARFVYMYQGLVFVWMPTLHRFDNLNLDQKGVFTLWFK